MAVTHDIESAGHVEERRDEPLVQSQRSDPLQIVVACAVGVIIALSGFPPLNDIPALLHVADLPGFALLTPPVLVVALAFRGRRSSRTAPLPGVALLAIGILFLAGCLSLIATKQSDNSLATLIVGLVAPAGIFVALQRRELAPTVLIGSFLAALSVVLAWADLVFLRSNGFPTPAKLFAAKFASHAHDFHYYTLGNPDHTATFLLLPLTVCLCWLRDRELTRRGRNLLLLSTVVIAFTILLLYVRLPMIVAFVMILVAVATSRISRRTRIGAVAVALGAAAALTIASPSSYLTDLFSTSHSSSGRVRLGSVSHGFRTLGHHLLTGVGIGQFGTTTLPAHSSIVQAGAEMGLLGLIGIALITVALLLLAVVRWRDRNSPMLVRAAATGAGVYLVIAAVSAGADDGLFVGQVSIYGMTLAMFAGVAVRNTSPRPEARVGVAVGAVLNKWWTRAGQRWHALARGRRLAWFWYGLAWTPIAVALTSSRLPSTPDLSTSRLQALADVLLAHHAGLGPLVGMLPHGAPFPIAMTDDQGSYLITPWLSDLLHTSSANTIIRTVFLIGVGVLVATYPVAIRRLTRSRLAAILAPLLVLAFFSFLPDDGFYWVPAATIAACLPWLLIFVRERRAPTAALIFIAGLAGITDLFRSEMGLGLLLGCVVICVLAAGLTLQRRAVTIALLALSYFAFSAGVLDLAFQARGDRMQSYPLSTYGYAGVSKWSDGSGHPFWHTAYIGLGVVHNRYGITYDDQVAAAYVRRIDAAAPYVGPQYESILRHRVLHLIASDPGFVLRAERRKLGEVLAASLYRFWPLLLLIPPALVLGAGRGRRKRYTSVFAAVAAIAVLPPMLAVPRPDYEMPWLGLLAATGILGVAWWLATAERLLATTGILSRHPLAGPFQESLARWRRRRAALVALVQRRSQPVVQSVGRMAARVTAWLMRPLNLMVTAVAGFGPLISEHRPTERLRHLARSRTFYAVVAVIACGLLLRAYLDNWNSKITPVVASAAPGSTPLAFDVVLPPAVDQWRLASVPRGWYVVNGTRVRKGSSLSVATTTLSYGYQLESPIVTLSPGTYVAAVRGKLQTGGLAVGVLDAAADKWIQVASYQSQPVVTRATFITNFTIRSTKRVQLVLTNNSPSGTASQWELSQALLASRSAPPISKPLPPTTKLPTPVRQWTLTGLPSDWGQEPGTVLQSGSRLRLTTPPLDSRYQILSPELPLPPGRYVAAVRGEIVTGGLGLGVLDVHSNGWIRTAPYVGTSPPGPGTMINAFSLREPATIRLILYNVSPANHRSTWLLSKVLVAPQGATSLATSLLALPAAGH